MVELVLAGLEIQPGSGLSNRALTSGPQGTAGS